MHKLHALTKDAKNFNGILTQFMRKNQLIEECIINCNVITDQMTANNGVQKQYEATMRQITTSISSSNLRFIQEVKTSNALNENQTIYTGKTMSIRDLQTKTEIISCNAKRC